MHFEQTAMQTSINVFKGLCYKVLDVDVTHIRSDINIMLWMCVFLITTSLKHSTLLPHLSENCLGFALEDEEQLGRYIPGIKSTKRKKSRRLSFAAFAALKVLPFPFATWTY